MQGGNRDSDTEKRPGDTAGEAGLGQAKREARHASTLCAQREVSGELGSAP